MEIMTIGRTAVVESLSADPDEAPAKRRFQGKARKRVGNGRRDAAIN
jgi:hypothetical protein